MNQTLARRCLGRLMEWDLERTKEEFRWLDLISRLKYDDYGGYFAGARFVECLLDWLQQFARADRETAYQFLRQHLVFVSASEMQHIIELFYPEFVRRILAKEVARRCGVKDYLVWSNDDLKKNYRKLLRETLFMGLSDGARLDTFRRANVGLIKNEQVAATIDIDDERWSDLVKELRKDTGNPKAQFRFVFLVDDFAGSGLTLLRDDPEKGWKGKLIRFWEKNHARIGADLSPDATLVVHHYLASAQAADGIRARSEAARVARGDAWFKDLRPTFGTVLPSIIGVTTANAAAFIALLDSHYNSSVMTPSLLVGGPSVKLGFAGCALPLVIEHNTPNNSVAILWAEVKADTNGPEMRPLFRRRQRHL